MDILMGFIVVTLIGLIAGVLLALASHFMGVKEDETVAKVRECLPGINCGACGYNGCDEYARALAAGGVKTNLCVPGADSVAQQISNILKVAFEDVVEMCAFVHCNGNCEATSPKSAYEGPKTCKAANMVYGGPGKCIYGCLGCGDCAKSCPVHAICMEDGIAHVNKDICVGCGLCVKTCPKGIISLIPLTARVTVACSNKEKGAVAMKNCKNACIGCKKCEMVCPTKAAKVEDNISKIDYSLCTACGKCVEACPTKCIHFVGEE